MNEFLVMRSGFSRYRDRACWSSMSDSLLENNQGGTADVNSSLRSYDLRDFLILLSFKEWVL